MRQVREIESRTEASKRMQIDQASALGSGEVRDQNSSFWDRPHLKSPERVALSTGNVNRCRDRMAGSLKWKRMMMTWLIFRVSLMRVSDLMRVSVTVPLNDLKPTILYKDKAMPELEAIPWPASVRVPDCQWVVVRDVKMNPWTSVASSTYRTSKAILAPLVLVLVVEEETATPESRRLEGSLAH